MHILLVEDDLINQKIALQLLTRWGIEVTVANDGEEAIELLENHQYDLVLMDLNMPRLDGSEATKKIRANSDPYLKQIPILAYTASPLADSKEKAEKLGMNDFISKPLNPEEMHCKINHYVLAPILEERPLKIKFELYADTDLDFRTELVVLMIDNLHELQQACYKAYYTNEPRIYQKASHKIKSTLILLDDAEFSAAIEDLKNAFSHEEKHETLQEKINKLIYLSESIIKTLEKEITVLRAAC